ncbi:MAG: BON domain-containing protein [Bergeyella sp.]|nr:BON domain-containing protein [Bergeyella sp.]
MKFLFGHRIFLFAYLAFTLSLSVVSCKKEISDSDLQSKASAKITVFPNASVEVRDGVVTLSGKFASQEEKDVVIHDIRAIEGVKQVDDFGEIVSPVEVEDLSASVSSATQQKVADALKDFPSVRVGIVNGELTLTGNVSPTQARKIKESIDALRVGKVNFNYAVK